MTQAAKKKVFDGRYEILSIVGRGAASVVYHARHVSDPSSEVALKVLLAQKDASPTAQRLRKEALAMVSSRHRYVIRLDDFHSVGDLSYLSMEFAPESDLRKFIAKRGGKLPIAQLELFMLQAAEGLSFVHQAGIVHRDIKPDNLLIINDKEVRLGDFGVAVLPGETSSIDELQKGVGTFDYMAPEVLEGKFYDKRSDVYALGVTFYELLAGRHPFAGVSMIKQLEAREDKVVAQLSSVNPAVPQHLNQVIMRAMRYEADERFSSAKELVQSLLMTRTPGERSFSVISKNTEPPSAGVEAEKSNESTVAVANKEQVKQRDFDVAETVIVSSGNLALKQNEPNRGAASANDDNQGVDTAPKKNDANSSPAKKEIPGGNSGRSLSGRAFEIPDLTSPAVAPEKITRKAQQRPSRDRKNSDRPSAANKSDRAPAAPLTTNKSGGMGQLVIALATILLGYFVWSKFSTPPVPTQEVVEASQSDSADSSSEESANDWKGNSGSVSTRRTGAFPFVPPGIYHGKIEGVIPGRQIPLSIIAFEEPHMTVVLLGIEGWHPAIASPVDVQDASGKTTTEARVASNGIVLKMTGQGAQGELIGVFTNLLTGDTGEWSAKLS